MARQKTLATSARIEGVGLHTGAGVRVEMRPAPAGTGIVFVRRDLPGAPRVPATLDHLTSLPRRTALAAGSAEVHTVEHLLATLAAMGIHNLEVHLDGPEVPGMDGSALPFYEALREAGVAEQDASVAEIRPQSPVTLSEDGASVAALSRRDGLYISYTLEYDSGRVPAQSFGLLIDEESFAREIAPARTFVLLEEVERLRAAGLGKGATTRNTLVLGPDGILENELRFEDEFVRHKILDLMGDLYLTNCRISAAILAARSGHGLNVKLARTLAAMGSIPSPEGAARARRDPLARIEGDPFEPLELPLDARAIERILPHRYPFLLVDRVLEIRDGRMARGVKCVTYNEGFFQGHFPGRPVMPGVLVVEAMAQLGGILLKSHRQNRYVDAYLLSLDKVKFRRPVLPGDQLIIESEVRRMKPRSSHVSSRALVDGQLASEAEIRYALIPNSQPNAL